VYRAGPCYVDQPVMSIISTIIIMFWQAGMTGCCWVTYLAPVLMLGCALLLPPAGTQDASSRG
jgi:uncharacterized membrane protein YhhN